MSLAPRFLVNLSAGYRVARFSRRRRARGHDAAAQQAAFRARLAGLVRTEIAGLHDLDANTTYAQFRERVPVRPYARFAPFIRRMAVGEANVLVAGRCPLFVETAGTTGEAPKLLPVPDAMLAHYRCGLRDALFGYAERAGSSRVFLGRHLQVGASTEVTTVDGARRASFDGVLALSLSPWAEANLRSPAPEIAALPEGADKIAATARAMLRQDVRLVAGTPAQIGALVHAAREAAPAGRQGQANLAAVWPNLECIVHTGTPLGVAAEALRAELGPAVKFHDVYAGAEGIYAAQDDGTPHGLRLLADTGIFFEFLPLALYQEANLARLGPQCVPLAEVQPGVDYVTILTTPAGLVRYASGDIVRFSGTDPARLQFVGRTGLQLDAAGEHVTERDLVETLLGVCKRNGWQAVAFHVAPYEQRLGPGQVTHAHEWWLELHTHTLKTPTANVLGPELDAELRERCPEYASRRSKNALDAPLVRLVMPGVFDNWARDQQRIAGASKLPCCRPDRLIADQLAALAPFHQATIAPFRSSDAAGTGAVIG